jgi:hypothetical protein
VYSRVLLSALVSIGLLTLAGCGHWRRPTLISPGAPKVNKDFDFEQIRRYAADVSAYRESIEGKVAAATAIAGGAPCPTAPAAPNTSSKLAFCTQTGKLVVQVQDINNKLVSSAANAIRVSSTPPGVTGETTITALNGVAVFDNLYLNSPGTYKLTAQSSGLETAITDSFTMAAVNLDRAKYFRNKIIDKFTGDVDQVYGEYVTDLYAGRGFQSIESDLVSLGLTAASAISVVARTKTILASLAIATAGINLSIDKNVFGQQTFAALSSAMQARRDQARNSIIKNELLSVTDYTLDAGRRDLISYFYCGTLPGAIQEIQEEATQKSEGVSNKGAAEASNTTGGAATKLAFIQPSNANVNAPLSIQVEVQDSSGKAVTAAANSVSIAPSPSAGVTGLTPTSAVNGVATFHVTFSNPGAYMLVAITTGLNPAVSPTIVIVPAGAPIPPVPAPTPPPAPQGPRITEGLH